MIVPVPSVDYRHKFFIGLEIHIQDIFMRLIIFRQIDLVLVDIQGTAGI